MRSTGNFGAVTRGGELWGLCMTGGGGGAKELGNMKTMLVLLNFWWAES